MFDGIPLFTAVPYDVHVARVVLRAKEEQNKIARSLLSHTISKLLEEALNSSFKFTRFRQIRMIPIPSSPKSNRSRGGEFLIPILRDTLDIQRARNPELAIEVRQLLKQRRGVRDQSGLSESQRERNMKGAIVVDPRKDCRDHGRGINILVDDVITTGSTLLSALTALKERNVTIHGVITACASARRLAVP